MADIEKRVTVLEAEVSRIQKDISDVYRSGVVSRPICVLCGSNLRLHTGTYYCTQDNDVCGELFLSGTGGQGHPKAYFRRTQYDEFLVLNNFVTSAWTPVYHVAFIAGRKMSVKEYIKWWKLKDK